MSQNNRKTLTRATAKVWMYLSMIVLLSQAQTAHSSFTDFAVSSPIMNSVIASYSGQSLSCSSSPNAFPTACAVTDDILTSNSGQNIATAFPAITGVMTETIDTYTGVNCFPQEAIVFGSSSAALNVTINNNTSGSNFVTSGSGPITSIGNHSISIFSGSTNPPFSYTPSGAITFTADATDAVVINGDVYIYGSLTLSGSSKLTVNGNLYIDSSAADNVITTNSGTLTVTGTLYILGNGSNQTTLGSTLTLTDSDLVINAGGTLYLDADRTLWIVGTSTLTINGGTLTIDNSGGDILCGTLYMLNTSSLTINNGGTLTFDNSGGGDFGGILYMFDTSSTTINNGGTLALDNSGGGSNGGILYMYNTSSLTINNGGTLNINSNCTLTINAGANLFLLNIGRITINGTQVANVSGNALTYTITGSTPTSLILSDENGDPVVSDPNITDPITIPATIVTGPYVA